MDGDQFWIVSMTAFKNGLCDHDVDGYVARDGEQQEKARALCVDRFPSADGYNQHDFRVRMVVPAMMKLYAYQVGALE